MTRVLLVRPEAEEEIRDARRWYDEQRSGLSGDFLLCLEDAFSKILRAPEAYTIVEKNVRRILTRRFPYGVFYIAETSRVVVLAVFHMKRNPKQWKGRT